MVKAWRAAWQSFCSNMIISAALFPLDVKKTLRVLHHSSEATSVWLRKREPALLLRDVLASTLASSCSWGVFRGTYEVVKRRKRTADAPTIAVASSAASIAAILLTHPLFNVKSSLILASDPTSIPQCLKTTYSQGGFRALYRGLDSAVLAVPNVTVQMTVYEKLKCILPARPEASSLYNAMVSTVWAITSKSIATCATYPLSVIRLNQVHPPPDLERHANTLTTLRYLLREQGFCSMYRGFGLHFVRTVAHNSLSLVLFELISSRDEKVNVSN